MTEVIAPGEVAPKHGLGSSVRPAAGSMWGTLRRMTKYPRLVFGASLVGLMVLIAIVGPWVWDQSSSALVGAPLQKPSWAHPFGTDEIGRDELARVIGGGRTSITVAMIAIAIGLFFGILIGITAGHVGSKTDSVLMRFIDGLQAFPPLLLAVMIAAALGPGLFKAMIAVGIALIPAIARLARSEALRIRHHDYIDAARLSARHETWIVARHVVPNSMSALIVFAATGTAAAIIAEASLAFLGLGASPPTPDWGAMLHDGYPYLLMDMRLVLFPGAAIAILALGFVFLGDGLRDLLDPRTND
jgi:peptide/nickel transport system permease protein